MGASLIPVLFFTIVWGVVGGILPFLIPASPHKSVIQVIRKNIIAIVIIYNYYTGKCLGYFTFPGRVPKTILLTQLLVQQEMFCSLNWSKELVVQ